MNFSPKLGQVSSTLMVRELFNLISSEVESIKHQMGPNPELQDDKSFNFCRASEILYSMMWAEMEYVGSDVTELSEPLMEHIVVARRSLSLFQHHDGITGTAKDHVVVDYANM